MKTLATLLFVTLLGNLFSQVNLGETIINDVVVYTSASEIHYEKVVKLKKGENRVVFSELSPFIVENTINVGCENSNVEIITVNEQINFLKPRQNKEVGMMVLMNEVDKIENEQGVIQIQRQALEIEKELLFTDKTVGNVVEVKNADEAQKMSGFIQKRYTQIATDLYKLDEQTKEAQRRLEKLRRQIKQASIHVDNPISEIILVVNSAKETEATFTCRFLCSHSGWAPSYDFRFQGKEKPLQFNFKANVYNATGVAWNNISIKLSTADPIRGFSIPSMETKSGSSIPSDKNVEFKTIEVVNAVTAYDVMHEYTIPSDGKPYLIDVDKYAMNADFNYLLIPRLDPFGFLIAQIPNWNQYNLIPGKANIYSMGTYMGKTFLDTYAENDTLSLYLGKDKSIHAHRTENSKEHSRKIIGNYTVEKSFVQTQIKNNSNVKWDITVLDQVPVIEEDGKSKITIHNIQNAIHDKAEGLITWKLTLETNSTTQIDFDYEIKEPKEYYGMPKKRSFRTISCPSF